MMKKIGLLTFHDTTNFGSWLQTYGLYYTIRSMGYECDVIDYKCDEIVRREIPGRLSFTLNPKDILKDILFTSQIRKKYSNLTALTCEKMTLSPTCNRSSIRKVTDSFDKVIVGSDIVWGLDITDNDMTYFLDFINDKKRKIAFSSSIGTPWTPEQERLIQDKLIGFDAIAMRETDAAEQVGRLVNRKINTVCDPTMLIEADTWGRMASTPRKKEKYCLVYFDTEDRDAIKYAKKWATANNAKVYFINYGIPLSGVVNVKPLSIQEFLGLIKYAGMVCTASYHGLLFSTYFNRQLRYFNRAHKSRMISLTKRLGISSFDSDAPIEASIDYHSVNNRTAIFRAQSINILNNMLSYD